MPPSLATLRYRGKVASPRVHQLNPRKSGGVQPGVIRGFSDAGKRGQGMTRLPHPSLARPSGVRSSEFRGGTVAAIRDRALLPFAGPAAMKTTDECGYAKIPQRNQRQLRSLARIVVISISSRWA
jgi:hypothetical protein